MRREQMDLSPVALGYAAGTVSATLFTLCTLAVAIAPKATVASLAFMIHVDLTGLVRPITWSGYLAGVLCITIGIAVVFAGWGTLYNRFLHGLQVAARDDSIVHRTA